MGFPRVRWGAQSLEFSPSCLNPSPGKHTPPGVRVTEVRFYNFSMLAGRVP
jgi:hypothetical protein